MQKSKRFMFTLNNYTEEDVERISRLPYHYMVLGREVSQNGTRHLQGYVTFLNARSLSVMRNTHLAPGHVEIATRDSAYCIRYCEKSGNSVEYGKRPVRNISRDDDEDAEASSSNNVVESSPGVDEWGDAVVAELDELDSASALARCSGTTSGSQSRRHVAEHKRQRILEILEANNYDPLSVYREDKYLYANHFVQIDRICKAEHQQQHDQTPRAWKTKVFVYTGNPGSGKTYYAQRRMKGLNMAVYTKDVSEWWPNYRQQPIVFMDEYNDWFAWDQMLRLMSQLPETVPVKNSQAIFNARYLFITTHRDPTTWYNGVSGYDRQALLDRIDEWRVFTKRGSGQYVNELKRDYKDTSRRFLSMDEVEPITEEDEREERILVSAPASEPKRSLMSALMGVDERRLVRPPIAPTRATPMRCLDKYDRKTLKRKV